MTTEKRRAKLKVLAFYGRRGHWVRCFVEKRLGLVRVQWREHAGARQTESWPDTPENRVEAAAWAQGCWERISTAARAIPERPRTLQELWTAYATEEFPTLRARSQALYTEHFRLWALTWGWGFIAENTTVQMAAQFRKDMTAQGYAINSVRQVIYDVKRVFRWAESRELLQRNRLQLYVFKVAKEDRPKPPPEYRSDDYAKIVAELSPTLASQWRAWCALVICATQGARQNAVLHLRPDDVEGGRHEFSPAGEIQWIPGRIRWRPEWDKLGRDRTQPLRLAAQIAVEIALEWRLRAELGGNDPGEFLFFPGSSKNRAETYTLQSLWSALIRAEKGAGVEHMTGRGGHGLRRMLAGDVSAATKNPLLGLRAIGDTDPRMLERYVQHRDDELEEAFETMDGRGTA